MLFDKEEVDILLHADDIHCVFMEDSVMSLLIIMKKLNSLSYGGFVQASMLDEPMDGMVGEQLNDQKREDNCSYFAMLLNMHYVLYLLSFKTIIICGITMITIKIMNFILEFVLIVFFT